jgi:hypothetical protein
MMLRAVALPSRAGVIVSALRTIVAFERQAFNLGDGLDGNDRAADVPVTHDRRKAALALLLARERYRAGSLVESGIVPEPAFERVRC